MLRNRAQMSGRSLARQSPISRGVRVRLSDADSLRGERRRKPPQFEKYCVRPSDRVKGRRWVVQTYGPRRLLYAMQSAASQKVALFSTQGDGALSFRLGAPDVGPHALRCQRYLRQVAQMARRRRRYRAASSGRYFDARRPIAGAASAAAEGDGGNVLGRLSRRTPRREGGGPRQTGRASYRGSRQLGAPRTHTGGQRTKEDRTPRTSWAAGRWPLF